MSQRFVLLWGSPSSDQTHGTTNPYGSGAPRAGAVSFGRATVGRKIGDPCREEIEKHIEGFPAAKEHSAAAISQTPSGSQPTHNLFSEWRSWAVNAVSHLKPVNALSGRDVFHRCRKTFDHACRYTDIIR
jgi:hypothetical protein